MSVSTAGSSVDVVQTSCLLLGLPVQLDHRPVGDEVTRRAQYGLGAVCDRELLGVLFALPSDLAIPRHSLSARQLRLLRRAPDGVVELTRTDVVRLAVPPIRVRHVTLHSEATVANLRALSAFGPFCGRTLLTAKGAVSTAAVAEADRLGIGVHSVDGVTFCQAAEFTVRRHTAATWLFLEQAMAAIQAAGT
jgi:hypothetical protein